MIRCLNICFITDSMERIYYTINGSVGERSIYMNNGKNFFKSLITFVGVVTTLAALAAAVCVLYKKYKESLAKFNETTAECTEDCTDCENTCGVTEETVEVTCDYAEETEEAATEEVAE